MRIILAFFTVLVLGLLSFAVRPLFASKSPASKLDWRQFNIDGVTAGLKVDQVKKMLKGKDYYIETSPTETRWRSKKITESSQILFEKGTVSYVTGKVLRYGTATELNASADDADKVVALFGAPSVTTDSVSIRYIYTKENVCISFDVIEEKSGRKFFRSITLATHLCANARPAVALKKW